MLVFACAGVASCSLPFYSDKLIGRFTQDVPKWMGFCNAFAGGVLLAVGIMDLLNESQAVLAKTNLVFPLSCSLCVLSYLVLLGFESIVYPCLDRSSPSETSNEGLTDLQAIVPSSPKAFVLAGTLVFHTVLEGITLGTLQNTAEVVDVFLGIIAHKFAAGLALGIYCVKEGLSLREALPAVLAFSLAAPLGVGIGMQIETISGDTFIGVFLALAAGTFIYISTTEIAAEEVKGKLSKYIAFIIGVLAFTAILGITAALK
jgi:zinc transporter 1/2/3